MLSSSYSPNNVLSRSHHYRYVRLLPTMQTRKSRHFRNALGTFGVAGTTSDNSTIFLICTDGFGASLAIYETQENPKSNWYYKSQLIRAVISNIINFSVFTRWTNYFGFDELSWSPRVPPTRSESSSLLRLQTWRTNESINIVEPPLFEPLLFGACFIKKSVFRVRFLYNVLY